MEITYTPTPKQLAFHSCNTRHIKEVLFGGAAGGGKSLAIVMDAYEYSYNCPESSLIIFRRSYPELQESIILKALEFYPRCYTYNKAEKTLIFSNGSRLKFAYMEHEDDRYRYQGGEYSYIAFDELTHFSETQYLYMLSRLRNTRGYPNLMRATSNPGGKYHDWVKRRFIDSATREKESLYIPATIRDNPYLDEEEYTRQLMHLPDLEREALLNGNWDLNFGGVFKRSHFKHNTAPDDLLIFTAVDVAMSLEDSADRSAVVTVGLDTANNIYLLDVTAGRYTTHELKENILKACKRYAPISLGIEKTTASWHFVESFRELMRVRNIAIPFEELKPSGRAKALRIESFLLSAIQQGRFYIAEGAKDDGVEMLINEAINFPNGKHDDILDALSYAISMAFARPREGDSSDINEPYYSFENIGW